MRSKTGWNAATITVLGLIATGVYTMPRFNYQSLVARQVAVETDQKALEDKFQKINLLAGGNQEDRRRALVGMLDSLPRLIADLDNSLSALREEQSAILKNINDIQMRMDSLESSFTPPVSAAPVKGKGEGEVEGRDMGLELTTYYTEPIRLSEALKAKADLLSSRGTAEWTVEEFLRNVVELGIVPLGNTNVLSPLVHEALQRGYSTYKCTIDLINFEETMYIRQLVEEATDKGEYSEVPLLNRDGTNSRQPLEVDRGVLFVKDVPERGMKRFYRFPLEAHPEFTHFNALRNNARDHLVRDLSLLRDPANRD